MIDIKNFLAKYQGSKIKYIPNQGNAGDSLIGLATVQMFKELNIDYEFCKPSEIFEEETILYGGGGNLIGKYSGCRNFLLRNHERNNIVVLPHGAVDGPTRPKPIKATNCDSILENLSENVVLIARENTSYDYIKSKMKHPDNVLLSDDMAFHIKNIDKYKNTSCVGVCNAFRVDNNERRQLPKDNKDISADFRRPMFMKTWYTPDDVNIQVEENLTVAADNLFSYLSKFEEINTDRLHVGIAATLIGKTVNLYSGSYYKVAGVYVFSMRGRFNNVTYHMDNNIL